MGRGHRRCGSGLRTALITLGVALAVWSVPATEGWIAQADQTTLLRVDLKTGKRNRIDRGRTGDSADRALDALLDDATGKTFSTADLERIERALRRVLRARRPRGEPRLLLFLYPGRITQGQLKELREIVVDVQLVVDPCPRSVCRESVARHLELLGQAIGRPVLRTSSYVIRFKTIALRAISDMRQDEQLYAFSAESVIRAAKTRGGTQLVRSALKQRKGYAQQMATAGARKMRARRLRLVHAPSVTRRGQDVSVRAEIRSDRVRYKSHVVAALTSIVSALEKGPLQLKEVDIVVEAHVGKQRTPYRCKGYPVSLYLRKRIGLSELWSTYVRAPQRGGRRLEFNDADEGTPAPVAAAPDRTDEILSQNFGQLAPCLQAEASRRRSFRGVTLLFTIGTDGRATKMRTKERSASKRVRSCLSRALGRIRFQRHAGPPRQVTYPMYIQR